jgi:Flp pilus assembly protein TadD
MGWAIRWESRNRRTFWTDSRVLRRAESPGSRLETFLEDRPRPGSLHANLASVLLKLGKREEARQEANEAIRLGMKDHSVFKDLGLNPSR